MAGVGSLQHAIQPLEGLARVDELAFHLVLAHQDAALGVLGRVAAMDEDAVKAFHAQQAGQLAAAHLLVERLVAELGRLGVDDDVVDALGDGGHALQLLRLDFLNGHGVVEASVHVFEGVAKELPIDIKVADGVAVALITAVEFHLEFTHSRVLLHLLSCSLSLLLCVRLRNS